MVKISPVLARRLGSQLVLMGKGTAEGFKRVKLTLEDDFL